MGALRASPGRGVESDAMDVYQIGCDLRPGVSDLEFCERVDAYLGQLASEGLLEGHRILRRKLGLGAAGGNEFQVLIETRDLAQLDAAFRRVAERSEPIEGFHHLVNSAVQNASFGLYRDFPDPERQRGAERF